MRTPGEEVVPELSQAPESLKAPGRGPGLRAGDAGFTLLEVLVALAILSIAVVAAIQLFSGGLRLLKLAGEHEQATQIADEKARDIPKLGEGRDDGSEGAFTWERSIRAIEIPAELEIVAKKPYRVYAVTVQVRWGGNKSVEVATLRTARPAEPGEPSGSDGEAQ